MTGLYVLLIGVLVFILLIGLVTIPHKHSKQVHK